MPAFTPNLSLYLPGGGSLGIGGDDEAADIDKLNQNFQKLDEFAGKLNDLTGDTGWVEDASGIFSAGSGWSLSTFWARKRGFVMNFYVRVERTGGTITVGDDGDITNTPIGTFTAPWQPDREQVVSSGSTGRVGSGFLNSVGSLTLCAVGGTANISNGRPISLGGTILL